jgi:hypothetical protein
MNEYVYEYEKRFLIGCPVSRLKQRKLGIEAYTPPLGTEKRTCCRCKKHVFISREQIALYAENIEAGNMDFKCFLCARKDLADSDVVDIGARGGSTRMSMARTSDPITRTIELH